MDTLKLIFGAFLALGATLATPALSFFALRGLRRSIRKQLPSWRSALGLASISIILGEWLGFIILGAALRFGLRTSVYTSTWEAINLLIAIAGTLGAFALKSNSRIQAVSAGCFMTAIWITSLMVV